MKQRTKKKDTAGLSDEKVAKALGWKKEIAPKGGVWKRWFVDGKRNEAMALGCSPSHTTNLSTILWEIERRKLSYLLHKVEEIKGVPKMYYANVDKVLGSRPYPHKHEKTPELALCAALLAFLKENHA